MDMLSATRSPSPISEGIKIRILAWLSDEIKMIKRDVLGLEPDKELAQFCRNGVLFCDLINRVSGR